jgi:hypothetical protein
LALWHRAATCRSNVTVLEHPASDPNSTITASLPGRAMNVKSAVFGGRIIYRAVTRGRIRSPLEMDRTPTFAARYANALKPAHAAIVVGGGRLDGSSRDL